MSSATGAASARPDFSAKVAIVTGAAQGIGEAYARTRAAAGAAVVIGPGDFFAITADHLFADIWSRPGLTLRDRRLLLPGLLTGQGLQDVADIQIGAALRRAELTPDELREIAIFLTRAGPAAPGSACKWRSSSASTPGRRRRTPATDICD